MPDVPRRTVLAAALGGAVLLTFGDASGASATPLPSRSQYAKFVGKTSTASHGSHTYKVKLQFIRDVAGATGGQRDSCFNLIFSAVGLAVPDGIYVLRCSGSATNSLFLSGIGVARSTQALVNRSV